MKPFIFNNDENCHPVIFRYDSSGHFVALFPFEEELVVEGRCLVVPLKGEEYVRDLNQMIEATETAYVEQITPEVVDEIEMKKGWTLFVMNSEQEEPEQRMEYTVFNKKNKKPLSKDELIARLKAIASDETPREEHHGAMCYSPCIPPMEQYNCDICNCDIEYRAGKNEAILNTVYEMRYYGYDVKVESVCKSCAEKIKKELYPNSKSRGEEGYDYKKDIWLGALNHIFYFRFPNDSEYHRAIANDESQYIALLTLMKNKRMYSGEFGGNRYIADEIDTLEFMTGIKFDV